VRACHWKETPLGEYVTMGDIQALPEGELVLKEMANEDRAYFDAVQSIRTSIQSWEVKKQAEQDAKNSTPSKLLLPEFDSPQKMETKSPKKPVFSAEIKIPDELKRYLPEMILVKGGTATLGEAGKNYDTKFTPYTAELQDFYIGKYPITFEQYDYYCKDVEKTEPYFYAPNRPRGKLPVVNVSWKEANKYCRWLSEKTSLNFRLPYESEWEFAARGGLKSKGFKYAGSNNLDEVGWFWENSGDKPMYGKWKAGKTTENNCRPHPVGLKKPNELGIYDMSGNVWEWCDGTYGYFDYRDKVKRGGSCAHTAEFSEVTFRSSGRDKWGASDGGFRVVRVI
jgi:formylglycine-generating enzyme required for sulfatase activity